MPGKPRSEDLRVRAIAAGVEHHLVVRPGQAAERRGLRHRFHADADPVVLDARDVAQDLLRASRRGQALRHRPVHRGEAVDRGLRRAAIAA